MSITDEIFEETEAQYDQWGEQNHPLVYGETQRRQFEQQANHWKQINAARVANDTLSWDGILLEEVYEALAEIEPGMVRGELVQVAAVAHSMIDFIDRTLASFIEIPSMEEIEEGAELPGMWERADFEGGQDEAA